MAPGIRIATSAWLTTFAMAPDASSRDVAATLAANRLLQLIIARASHTDRSPPGAFGKNCRDDKAGGILQARTSTGAMFGEQLRRLILGVEEHLDPETLVRR